MNRFLIAMLVLLAHSAHAEDWQYFAVDSDGRWLSDDDTFRLVGTGADGDDDSSAEVKIKNSDSQEHFRLAIGLDDCVRFGNGRMLMVASSGHSATLDWDAEGNGTLDYIGAKLCTWAKAQIAASRSSSE